jgi:RHS repeat-associated protein
VLACLLSALSFVSRAVGRAVTPVRLWLFLCLALVGGRDLGAQAKPLEIVSVSWDGEHSDDEFDWVSIIINLKNNSIWELTPRIVQYDCKSYLPYDVTMGMYGPLYSPEPCLSAQIWNTAPSGGTGWFYLRLGRSPMMHMQDTVMVVLDGSSIAPPDTGYFALNIPARTVQLIRPPQPTVTPKQTAISAPSWTSRSQTFTIANAGNGTANYSLTPSCGGFSAGGCTVSPSSITIGGNSSGSATVTYMVPPLHAASATIGLTATSTGSAGLSDAGSVVVTSVDQIAPTIALYPVDILTNYARGFTINLCDPDGTLGTPWFQLNGAAVSPVTYLPISISGCANAAQADFPNAPLRAGVNSVSAGVSDGAHSTTASGSIRYDESSQVTPTISAPASSRHIPSGTYTVDDFIIHNPGPVTAGYQLTLRCDTPEWAITACSIPSDYVNVGAGQSLPIHVAYSTSYLAGMDIVVLSAQHQSELGTVVGASASMNVTVDPTYVPVFYPKTVTSSIDARIYSTSMITLYNRGTAGATFSIRLDCGAWAMCSTPVTSLTIGQNGYGYVPVYFTTGVPGTSSVLRVIATAPPAGGVIRADTSVQTLSAIDAYPPGISVSPTSSGITTRNMSVSVDVGDWESAVGDPTLTLNGTSIAATSIVATSTQYYSSKRATYLLPLQPGDNHLVATVSDGVHTSTAEQTYTYDDSYDHRPVVAPMHSAPGVPVARSAVDTFLVTNNAWNSAAYSLSVWCRLDTGDVRVCAATTPSQTITVPAGGTVGVPVTYPTGSFVGMHTYVEMDVSYTGPVSSLTTSQQFVATVVPMLPPQITISPVSGTTVTTTAVNLAVTWCDQDDDITQRSVVWQGASLPDNSVMTLVPGCHDSRTSAWTGLPIGPWAHTAVVTAIDRAGHSTVDSVTITRLLDVALMQPAVTPKTGSHSIAVNAVAADTFVVANAGSYPAAYALTPSCRGVSNCVASPSVLSLDPGTSAPVTVSFAGPTIVGVRDTVSLIARFTAPTGTSIADTGRKIVVAPALELAPTLTTPPTPIPVEPTYVTSALFSIYNPGSEPASYALHASSTGGFGFPEWYTNPAAVSVDPGQTAVVILFVKAPIADGITGSYTLTADYLSTAGVTLSGSATATLLTRAPQPRVAVTPKTGTYIAAAGLTATQVGFAVTNTGNVGLYGRATLICGVSSSTAVAGCAPNQFGGPVGVDVSLQPGTGTSVLADLQLRGGAPTSIRVAFDGAADAVAVHDTGTIVVRRAGDFTAVAVTPRGEALTVNPNRILVQRFSITNSGTVAASFDYGTICTGAAITCENPQAGSTGVLAANQSYSVLDSVTSRGAGLTGAIMLWARTGEFADTGTVSISTAMAADLSVNTHDVNAGTNTDRGNCLTIAAGDASAYECGDLRIVHPLPVTTTLNRPWAPALVYESRQHSGIVLFAADVAVAPGDEPSVLTAHVFVADKPGVTRTVAWDPHWSDGKPHRIVVPVNVRDLGLQSGAYHYRFALDPVGQSTVQQQQDEGTVAIVNRATSPFGPGWWLDGLEQLVPYTSTQILWIGGDGSTRLYTQSSSDSTTWTVQPAVDGIDSLTRDQATNHWLRHLGNGAYTEFDGAFRHIATVNRLGHRTEFGYANGALATITLPVPVGSSAAVSERTYTFSPTIDGTGVAQALTVSAPSIGGAPRAVTLNYTGGGSWTIAGPDTTHITIGLDAQNRVVSRTDRRGYATTFAYDSLGGGTLAGSRLSATSPTTVNIARAFSAGEAAGISAPVMSADVRTIYDGPRTDSSDVTTFTLNQFGAVTAVADPYGHTTTLERNDAHWPFLVTKVIAANGHVTQSRYDSTNAHMLTSTDVGGRVAGSLDSTRYVWNAKWDMVERIVPPAGDSTVIGIDPTTGDRLWEQDARGAMSRVTFTYDPTTRLVATVTQPGAASSDSVAYEPRFGDVDHTTTPRGAVTQHLRDAIGRDTLVTTPTTTVLTATATQAVSYDVMDRIIASRTVGPALTYAMQNGRAPDSASVPILVLATTNAYDAEGNLVDVSAVSEGSGSDASTVSTSSYDAANRVYRQVTGNGTKTVTYDAAGNVVALGYSGGGTASTIFDAMNRPVTRIVSGREYGRTTCDGFPIGPDSAATAPLGNGCFMVFPYFPNQPNGGTGLHVSGDTATFAYDEMGNVAQADNRAARIGRTYTPNGLLLSETATIGTINDPRTDGSSSTYTFSYDADGRRSSMDWQRGTTRYQYAPFGALDTVTDPVGNTYHLAYDAASRQDSLVIAPANAGAGGIWDKLSYDEDGQLTHRIRMRANSTVSVIHEDAIEYDLRGKVTTVHTAGYNHPGETVTLAYDGLGAVLARDATRDDGMFGTEEFRNDAFGNVLYSRTRSSAGTNDAPAVSAYAPSGGGRLLNRQVMLPALPTTNQANDALVQTFDGTNLATLSRLTTPAYVNGPGVSTQVAEKHYYTGDNRLAAVQRYAGTDNGISNGTWEEYWYDAFGRRVLTRVRRNSSSPVYGANALCVPPSGCRSYIERAVWDGDRLQYEERTAENGPADVQNSGSIGYIHLLDLDQPVAVLDVTTSVINYDWRGLAESSLHPDGTGADCSVGAPPPCLDVAWPGGGAQSGVYFTASPLEGAASEVQAWLGTLIANGAGTTGALYRRNRYFSTESGQFTQEDPSGLGGGLNTYGFAGGDPVNFVDPFGLSADCTTLACPLILGGAAVLGGPLTIFGAAVLGVVSADLAFGSLPGITVPSERSPADQTAYRPGKRFAPKTKTQIDQDATTVTGREGTCEHCGIILVPVPGHPNSTEYDHQKAKSKGGDNSPGNGRRSCRSCNRKFGADDKQDPRAPRPPESPKH